MFQFSCRFAFLSTFRLSNRTPKITRILTLYQANAPTLMRCNFFKHIPKLIIFGTHNMHTFKHNTLINELPVMQFYLFHIRPKLHHRKWRKLRVTLPVNMHALFLVCSLRDDNVIRSKPTWKLKHRYKLYSRVFWIFLPNVIKIGPYNFELAYTVSKSVRFFETQCVGISSSTCSSEVGPVVRVWISVCTSICLSVLSVAERQITDICSTVIRHQRCWLVLYTVQGV